MENNIKPLKRILNYSISKYINEQNDNNLEYLISTLKTLDDLNFTDIEISMVYLLLYLYVEDKNIFPYKIQSYLQLLFHTTFKTSLNLRIHLLEKELNNINESLNATSNIFTEL